MLLLNLHTPVTQVLNLDENATREKHECIFMYKVPNFSSF
jgi:hypothetical protein